MAKVVSVISSIFSFLTCKTVKARVKIITPAIANTMANWRYERQRPLKNPTITDKLLLMLGGRFRFGGVLSVAVYKGKRMLIDGNHTIHALIRSGMSMLFVVVEYYCETMKQVNDLYITFDTPSPRTLYDMFVALYPKPPGLSKKDVGKLLTATKIILNVFKGGIARMQSRNFRTICDTANALLPAFRAFLKAIDVDMDKLKRATLLDGDVLSVALITMEWQPKKATAFWRKIALGEPLATDPNGRFRELLVIIQQTPKRNALGQRTEWVPQTIWHMVASCWNNNFDGTPQAPIRSEDINTSKSIVIKGTPFVYEYTDPKFTSQMEKYGLGADRVALIKGLLAYSATNYSPTKDTELKVKKCSKLQAQKSTCSRVNKRRIVFDEAQLTAARDMREAGKSYREVGKQFEISEVTAYRVLKRQSSGEPAQEQEAVQH